MTSRRIWLLLISVEVGIILGLLAPTHAATAFTPVPGIGAVFSDDASTWLCDAPASVDAESPLVTASAQPSWGIKEFIFGPEPADIPRILIRLNQQGFRDDPFTDTPPADTTRIVVIGDSFTWGTGLNESQRYTEKLEARLDAGTPGDVEVINAGLQGAGMQDYHAIFTDMLTYNPDMVIVSFFALDAESQALHDKWIRRIRKKHNLSDETDPAFRKRAEYMEAFQQAYYRDLTFRTSPIRRVGNRMKRVAERNGVDLLFFKMRGEARISPPEERSLAKPLQYGETVYPSALEAWRQECGIDLEYAPAGIRSEQYRIPNDGHYNAAGNTVLAETLTATVLQRLGGGNGTDTVNMPRGVNVSRHPQAWSMVMTLERYLKHLLAEDYRSAYRLLAPHIKEDTSFAGWKRRMLNQQERLVAQGFDNFSLHYVRMNGAPQKAENRVQYGLRYGADMAPYGDGSDALLVQTPAGWRIGEATAPYSVR